MDSKEIPIHIEDCTSRGMHRAIHTVTEKTWPWTRRNLDFPDCQGAWDSKRTGDHISIFVGRLVSLEIAQLGWRSDFVRKPEEHEIVGTSAPQERVVRHGWHHVRNVAPVPMIVATISIAVPVCRMDPNARRAIAVAHAMPGSDHHILVDKNARAQCKRRAVVPGRGIPTAFVRTVAEALPGLQSRHALSHISTVGINPGYQDDGGREIIGEPRTVSKRCVCRERDPRILRLLTVAALLNICRIIRRTARLVATTDTVAKRSNERSSHQHGSQGHITSTFCVLRRRSRLRTSLAFDRYLQWNSRLLRDQLPAEVWLGGRRNHKRKRCDRTRR